MNTTPHAVPPAMERARLDACIFGACRQPSTQREGKARQGTTPHHTAPNPLPPLTFPSFVQFRTARAGRRMMPSGISR